MSDVATSELSTGQSAVRGIIEVLALIAWAVAGWHLADGPLGWALAVALPVVGAAAWGTFRVPGDASANGGAPVPVSGRVRLALELVVLLGGAVAVGVTWSLLAGAVLALLVSVHYSSTPARVAWLRSQH